MVSDKAIAGGANKIAHGKQQLDLGPPYRREDHKEVWNIENRWIDT